MSCKEFYDKISARILDECETEHDFLTVYKEIEEFEIKNNPTEEDTRYYRESGAAEFLEMNILDHLDEEGNLI